MMTNCVAEFESINGETLDSLIVYHPINRKQSDPSH